MSVMTFSLAGSRVRPRVAECGVLREFPSDQPLRYTPIFSFIPSETGLNPGDGKELFRLHFRELGQGSQVCILERTVGWQAGEEWEGRPQVACLPPVLLCTIIAPLLLGFQIDRALGRPQMPGGEQVREKSGFFHSFPLWQHLL